LERKKERKLKHEDTKTRRFNSFFVSLCLRVSFFFPFFLSSTERIDFSLFPTLNRTYFLENYQGKEVEIRGFLYSDDEEGDYLLAREPNLKSCCLKPGSQEKKAIHVEGMGLGNFVGDRATLKGVLYIDPENPDSDIHLLAAIPSEDDDPKYLTFAISLLLLLFISWVAFTYSK